VTGGILRVGVTANPPWTEVPGDGVPSGAEVELVQRLAEQLGAQVQWYPGSESTLMAALKDRVLDLVVGGLDAKAPWTQQAALTTPYVTMRTMVAAPPTGPRSAARPHPYGAPKRWPSSINPMRPPRSCARRCSSVETVAPGTRGDYTLWPTGYPDFPIRQHLSAEPGGSGVTISCLFSDLVFKWRLRADGAATEIEVAVELPDREAHRLPEQRRLMEKSLVTLAGLTAHSG
jgi:ABC-type amino acid transport substrate-binding protein